MSATVCEADSMLRDPHCPLVLVSGVFSSDDLVSLREGGLWILLCFSCYNDQVICQTNPAMYKKRLAGITACFYYIQCATLNYQELWLPTGDLCKIGPIFIFILKWAPGRGEWEEKGKKGEGRVSWGMSVPPRHFLQWYRALSCPCSCKHLVTLVYSQAARGWSVSFLPCAISGERVHLVGSQSAYSSVFLSAQEEAALWGGPFGRVNGRTRFIFVFCLFWTTLLFLSRGYHQSG